MDLNDTTTYSSAYSEANVVVVGAKQTTQDAIDKNLRSTEYSYDFSNDEMLVAYESDLRILFHLMIQTLSIKTFGDGIKPTN